VGRLVFLLPNAFLCWRLGLMETRPTRSLPSNPMRTKTLRRGDMIAREMVLEVVKRVDEGNVRYLSSIGRLFLRTASIAWNGRRGSRLISACDELRGLRGSALKHPRRSSSTR
jgi:hypothetical protein